MVIDEATTRRREQVTNGVACEWMLVSDVDDTLLGDEGAFEEFVAVARATAGLLVVVDSSRPIPSVLASFAATPTEWRPDGIIGALGTEILLAGRRLQEWERRFATWDRRPVDAVMARLGFPSHEPEFQTPAKASFAVPAEARATARRALAAAGIAARIVASGETNFDVLPPGAGKAPAARHLATRLGVPLERVVTVGDSANDADLLRLGRGVLVANATSELRDLVADTAVYRSPCSHARGVVDGLRWAGVPVEGARP